jgi:uncharacterized protein YqhQ
MTKKVYIGGQAIIEGVMMKGPKYVGTAARTPKGKIVKNKFKHESITYKNAFFRLPVLRGIIFLFEMMILGLKTLAWSADQQGEEHDEKLSKWEIVGTMTFSFGLAILLFVVAPYYITRFFTTSHDLAFNLIDGFFRLAIFLGYLIGISFLKDVKRLFQYHGAEHKAVHCFESGKKLTVKNVQSFSTIHPRCGTSLIVFVIGISIVIFSLIQVQEWYWNVLLRIIVIPLVGGLAYEMLKFGAKFQNNWLIKILILPGLWVQKITTSEPEDDQVEVAIASLKQVLP